MPLRVTNVRLPVTLDEEHIGPELARRLAVDLDDLAGWRILKKSLDGRSRNNLKFVYSVAVEVVDEENRLEELARREGVDRYLTTTFDDPVPGSVPLEERPVVIGSGPAGMLAAYFLATRGYRPLILERGPAVKDRVSSIRKFDSGGEHDPDDNYLFGEGGAGTFSDGKLTCRLSGPDIDWVLQRFAEFSRQPSVAWEQRPHLGSNRLPFVVRNFRQEIEAAGGEYRFGCRFEGLEIENGQLVALATSGGRIATSSAILAIGHSARDTYEMLLEAGIPMEPRAFQLGLRIEQPQSQIDAEAYGRPEYRDLLGAANYNLVAKGDRDVYTFCMCAGGHIIPSVSEPEMFCTNGMSNSRHDTEFASSGVMVTVEPREFGSSDPLAGVRLQQQFEAVAYRLGRSEYLAPAHRAADFMAGRSPDPAGRIETSYVRGNVPASLEMVLPSTVISTIKWALPLLNRKYHKAFLPEAVLVGPEMRGSAPVRISRDRESFQSPGCRGLYPVGEGAGFAGGIISAAVDGVRAAKAIVGEFAPVGDA
jgi:uncharacterized FAD-dependent dehydrogenase